MALVDIDSIESLLACPRCRCGLVRTGDGFHCSSTSCAYHAVGSFPVVGGLPVLLDHERSIMSPNRLIGPGNQRTTRRSGHLRERVTAAIGARLRSLVRPPNRVARANTRQLLQLLGSESPLVLVIGGASKGNGVEALYDEPGVRVVAFDIQPSGLVQLIADAHQIPMATGSVQAVVVQAVLEHVLEPASVADEIHRVLTEGGLVYAETPFMQQVHGAPFDFTRFTASGHRYLFRRFEEIRSGPVAGPGTQLLWSVDHVVRAVFRSPTAGRIAKVLCFWLRYLDAVVPDRYAADDASAFFFLGRRSEDQVAPRAMLGYRLEGG